MGGTCCHGWITLIQSCRYSGNNLALGFWGYLLVKGQHNSQGKYLALCLKGAVAFIFLSKDVYKRQGLTFIGCKVDVIFDPADISELTIEYEGHQPFKAKELVIGERSAPRPKLPEHLQKAPADSSRQMCIRDSPHLRSDQFYANRQHW